jgi:hypothetical protein
MMFCVGIFLKTDDSGSDGRKGSSVAVVAEHFRYTCLSNKTTASPQLRRFEAVRHNTYCRGPFLKPLVKGGRLLLQRSLSRKCREQRTEEIIDCLANS